MSSNFLLDKGCVAENLQNECLCYFIISKQISILAWSFIACPSSYCKVSPLITWVSYTWPFPGSVCRPPIGTYPRFSSRSSTKISLPTAPSRENKNMCIGCFYLQNLRSLLLIEWIDWLFNSHSTIFQLYMWRHTNVKGNWRRSWTYVQAPTP